MKKYLKLISFLLLIVILSLMVTGCFVSTIKDGPVSSILPTRLEATLTLTPTQTATITPIKTACTNPFYPVVESATWNYSIVSSPPDTFVRTITEINPDGFTSQDIFSTGTNQIVRWECQEGTLIALDPAGTEATSSVVLSGLDIELQATDQEGITLPSDIKEGDTWSQHFTVEGILNYNGQDVSSPAQSDSTCVAAGEEMITVPAGSFSALRVDCIITIEVKFSAMGFSFPFTIESNSTSWYSPGIGMVRNSSIAMDDSTTTVELTSYTLP